MKLSRPPLIEHVLRMCTPSMLRIAEELDITVCAGVWGNGGPTIVGWETGTTSMLPSFPLGLVLPVTGSATGKAFSASLPADTTDPFVNRELAETAHSLADERSRWQAALEEVRSTGIARHPPTQFWNGDMLITAASVPVRGSEGEAIVTMSAVVDSTIDPGVLERACERLKEEAAKIERQLGFLSEKSLRSAV